MVPALLELLGSPPVAVLLTGNQSPLGGGSYCGSITAIPFICLLESGLQCSSCLVVSPVTAQNYCT